MGYLAGIAGFGGGTRRDPGFHCDGEGCDAFVSAMRSHGTPYAWFLRDNPKPPGWKRVGRETFCKRCTTPTPEEAP